jgi:hypothetical protein
MENTKTMNINSYKKVPSLIALFFWNQIRALSDRCPYIQSIYDIAMNMQAHTFFCGTKTWISGLKVKKKNTCAIKIGVKYATKYDFAKMPVNGFFHNTNDSNESAHFSSL